MVRTPRAVRVVVGIVRARDRAGASKVIAKPCLTILQIFFEPRRGPRSDVAAVSRAPARTAARLAGVVRAHARFAAIGGVARYRRHDRGVVARFGTWEGSACRKPEGPSRDGPPFRGATTHAP